MTLIFSLLKEIHDKCDQANFEYGKEKELCIFCKIENYDGIVGVKHKPDCIILKMRKALGIN